MQYYVRKVIKRIIAFAKIRHNKSLYDDLVLRKRYRIICDARRQNKKLVCYLLESQSDTARYRCRNVAEVAGPALDNWAVTYFYLNEYKKIKPLLCKDDIVVLMRLPFSGTVKSILGLANKKKIKVLYDVDDLVCSHRWLNDIKEGLGIKNGKEIKYWDAFLKDHEKAANIADGFIVTNEFLGEKIKKEFKKPYQVISNSLNFEQVKVSNEYLKKKKEHGGFVVGYFSGSPTHKKDFALIEAQLIKFLDKYQDGKLRIVGYMDLSKEMKDKEKEGRVELLPPVDYLTLQKMIAEVDVNIAPLVINNFTNCKSELKFFEAAVVEITTIASPSYSFNKAIKDGENGLLAQPGEWYSKLEYLYKHPEENKRIAKIARDYALKHYYGKEFLKEVESAYEYFAK